MEVRRLLLSRAGALALLAIGFAAIVPVAVTDAAAGVAWLRIALICGSGALVAWSALSGILFVLHERWEGREAKRLERQRDSLVHLLEHAAADALRTIEGVEVASGDYFRTWRSGLHEILNRWMDSMRVDQALRDWGLMDVDDGKLRGTGQAYRAMLALAARKVMNLAKDIDDGKVPLQFVRR